MAVVMVTVAAAARTALVRFQTKFGLFSLAASVSVDCCQK